MKKLIYTAIAAMSFCGSSLLMTSCDDLLDTKSPSSMDDSNIFSIYDLAEGTIKNIYIYYGEQNYRARYLPWYGFNTDIEWYNSSEQVGDGKADLAVYKTTATNSQMNLADGKEPWSNIYQGIEKANLAIQGLKTYADLSDSKMAHLYGEALTLRAMAYVDLINAWGDVPARFEPTTMETMYAPKADKDIIYKQLIKDLQEAENMVAWPNTMDATNTVERINKAFVKGLLARICLQASGYSLRADGNSSLSSDPELSKSVLYPIALQACKDVMAEEGTYVALKSNFEDIFIDNCRDVIKAGSESLWEIPYNNEPTARGRQVSTFGLRHETADVMVNYKQSGGQAGPTPFFFFDYSKKDKRRDVTCAPYKWNKGVQELNSIDKWYFGKLRYEWMNRYIESTDDGINKQYMRYADIVLMRAELENELNGPAAAAPYLKQIRQRAFDQADWTTEVDQYVTAVQGNKNTMFDAIVQERALELCGEFVRKADLIRWNLLKTKLDEAKAKMYRLRDLQGEYAELSGHLYYKMEDYTWTRNGTSNTIKDGGLVTYGLNRDEQDINPAGYTEYTNSSGETKTWISSSQLKDEKIEAIYAQDPVKYMYWPIFQVNLNANPELKNYSWYN